MRAYAVKMQIPTSTHSGYNGRMDKKASGLGLYLCKGVCEKLGHEIRVVSEEGEGTTVILTLQLEKVQQRDLVNM